MNIEYNEEKDLKIEYRMPKNEISINLNDYKSKNLMSYRQIIIIITGCVDCDFTIHGYDTKPNNLNVNKVGKICTDDKYNSELCHHLSKDRYSYICKNPNNENYTLKNNIVDFDFVKSDCYYIENNKGGIENQNMKCDSKTCEYFTADKIIKFSTNLYNYYNFNVNDTKYMLDSEIKILDKIIRKEIFSEFLIVIDNSNIKKIMDYNICLSTKELTNDDKQKYINKSKNKRNMIIDLDIKKSDGEIIFGNKYYKLNKCENNICTKIQKTDYLLYGDPIDKNTIINVAPLRKLIDGKPFLENTNINCFNENIVDKKECYLTPTNILSKQLMCNRVDDNVICVNPNPNINEQFTVSDKESTNKCNLSENLFTILFIIILGYVLIKY